MLRKSPHSGLWKESGAVRVWLYLGGSVVEVRESQVLGEEGFDEEPTDREQNSDG